MRKIIWLTSLLGFALPQASAAAPTQESTPCELDLNAVLQFLAEDYAGYPRFAKNWPDRLEGAIGRARADVVGVEGKECDRVIRRLLAVFHDGHLGLHSQFSPAVEMPTPMFYEDRSPKAVPLASDAFLVRVPSFAVSYKEELDRLLAKHADEIRTRPYLVIDVRGNTGGGDTTWVNLIEPVLDGPTILAAQRLARHIVVAPHVQDYAIRLTLATHPGGEHAISKIDQYVHMGVSPRGVQALITGAKVKALIDGRYAAGFSDVRDVVAPAMRHRIIRSFEAEADGVTTDDIIQHLLDAVPYDMDQRLNAIISQNSPQS